MNNVTEKDFKEIIKNPAAFYKAPIDVVKDKRLSTDQSDKILEIWADDQKQLLVAEGESMTEDHETEDAALTLQKISEMQSENK